MRVLNLATSAATLATFVWGQGYNGGSQSSCASGLASFSYQGCYGATLNGGGSHVYSFKPTATNTDGLQYYPGFNSALLTIEMCMTACRGHGWRYASLYSNNCYCGSVLPAIADANSVPPSNSSTLATTCHQGSLPANGCPGNTAEWCGIGGSSEIYGDSTFPTVILNPNEETKYNYLGCFTTGSNARFFTTSTVTGVAGCQKTCADAGYPYAGLTSATGCQCGTDFNENSLQAPQEATCGTACSASEYVLVTITENQLELS
ncbi:MAG: hypothetical protein M1829_001160 [Trizodia sp. TS-e1964]|nr:MAG: hypothetical protein M1829_001160 [Trizodia sp. TS-e1964]